jgi:hypothetical protein
MDEGDDGIDEGTKKTKNPLYVLKEDKFEGRTVYESYWYNRHRKTVDPKDVYSRLCDVIDDGAELLYLLLQTNEMKGTDIKEITELYESARVITSDQVPVKSTQKVGWADPASKTFEIITLTAADGGDTSFQPELYEKSEQRFEKTQYWHHIKELRKIDTSIYHFLVKYKVIPTTRSLDDIFEEQIKQDLLQGDK